MSDSVWITAAEAARRLGVSRNTLYAYVSRGLLRSQPAPGSTRARRYAGDDVDRLRRRTEERRDPDKAAARALHWGLPVLESAITVIDGRRLYYRGLDAIALAQSRTVAEVASLIWTGQADASLDTVRAAPVQVSWPRVSAAPFVARAQAALAAASVSDVGSGDLRQQGVVRTGWRILHLLTSVVTGSRDGDRAIDEALTTAWARSTRDADLVRGALILCADHELNASSFAARVVASAGSHPYAVVLAGLAALEGVRHGGASARVEAMLGALRREKSPARGIADRLRRGEPIDGFGHPLYRDGDPRAQAILAWLAARYPRSEERRFVTRVAAAAAAATGERPNLDFALAALARVLRLPPGSPLVLFAIGRTIGWIGHAIEQYATGQLIRPRAKYVGVPPVPSQAPSSTLKG